MQDLTHQTKETHSENTVLYEKIQEIDTSPLTRSTISKKHVRILVALFMIEDNSNNRSIYVNPETLQALVAQITFKRYPYLDIVSFSNDLYLRTYVDMESIDDGEKCYRITDQGIALLEQLSLTMSIFFEGSTTPNFYPVIH